MGLVVRATAALFEANGGWRRGVQTRLWPEVTRGGELMSRISEASPLSFLSWMMFM